MAALGWLMNLGLAGGAGVTIVPGPYRVVHQHARVAGPTQTHARVAGPVDNKGQYARVAGPAKRDSEV